jgi:hypothetical protein
LNVHNVSDVGQTEVQTAESSAAGPHYSRLKIAITKLKKYESADSDQILAELIQAGGETLLSVIHKLINSIWNKAELPDQWKESVIVPVHKRVTKLNVIIIVGYNCYQLHTDQLLIRIKPRRLDL